MSKETLQDLNSNTLIGLTDKRGNAWHYRAGLQGNEPNHYPGFVPVEDVRRRLFSWHAIELPIFIQVPCGAENLTGIDDAGQPFATRQVPNRKAIVRDDTFATLGVFSDGYQGHQYDQWLLDNVEAILGEGLGISSAGLLKGGARAWVEVSLPENLVVEGVEYRPNLLSYTSFDGSLATGYASKNQLVVCDNTFASALNERGLSVKIRHSKNSGLRITEAREALGILVAEGEAFGQQVTQLVAQRISTREWSALLDAVAPVPEVSGRAATLATNKREALQTLWDSDARVTPWKGTAFGALQAYNTYATHIANVRGASRAERNALANISGTAAAADAEFLQALQLVTA